MWTDLFTHLSYNLYIGKLYFIFNTSWNIAFEKSFEDPKELVQVHVL